MFDDRNSEISDISINTDLMVFKGGLGLVKGNHKIDNKHTNKKNNVPQTENKVKPNSNTANSLNVNNNPSANGLLSFRSKKDVQGINQIMNSVTGSEDTVDTSTITKQIIDKLGVLKIPTGKKKTDVNHYPKLEKEEINKVFIKTSGNEIEETEKEIKNFELENSPLEEYDNNNLEIGGEVEEVDEEQTREDEKNIFWNLRENIDDQDQSSEKSRSKSVIAERKPLSEKKSQRSKEKEIKILRKETFLSSIVCTLSRIEKGKAIFVSTDDFIFVLPALFVPRNLVVGNTYSFKISEYDKFQSKISNIIEVQKKYSNKSKNNIQTLKKK